MIPWDEYLATLDYLEQEGLIEVEYEEDEYGDGEIRYYPGEEPWLPNEEFLK